MGSNHGGGLLFMSGLSYREGNLEEEDLADC